MGPAHFSATGVFLMEKPSLSERNREVFNLHAKLLFRIVAILRNKNQLQLLCLLFCALSDTLLLQK